MKFIHTGKAKTAFLAAIMAFAINNPVLADHYSVSSINLDSDFTIKIGSGDGGGYYLTYSPNDRVVGDREKYTLKGGELYIYSEAHYIESDSSYNWVSLGNAADILGEGISEDEIKDLISDAIHKVDGDQTVTGDQQVDGEQTVNGGQSVSGGQTL